MQKTLAFQVRFEAFEEDGRKGFNVTVPALPGCFTWGETLEEARAMAQEAILLFITTLQEKGLPIPEV
jgi:predicted RNase H-like HicB family nuclease